MSKTRIREMFKGLSHQPYNSINLQKNLCFVYSDYVNTVFLTLTETQSQRRMQDSPTPVLGRAQ